MSISLHVNYKNYQLLKASPLAQPSTPAISPPEGEVKGSSINSSTGGLLDPAPPFSHCHLIVQVCSTHPAIQPKREAGGPTMPDESEPNSAGNWEPLMVLEHE